MTALMRLERAAPSPRTRAADLDERWERTILKCLAREAADRPSSAREVFLAIASAGRVIAPTILDGLQAPPLPAPPARWPFAVAAAAIVLASAAIIVVKVQTPPRVAQAAPVTIAKPAAPPPPPLEKPVMPSAVILRSEPPGATVIVDDQVVATTPTVVQLVLPRDVTVQLDGYRPQTQRVETPGELTLKLSAKPKARPAPRPAKRLLDE